MQSRSPGWSVTGRGFGVDGDCCRNPLVRGDLAQHVLQDAAVAVVVRLTRGVDARHGVELDGLLAGGRVCTRLRDDVDRLRRRALVQLLDGVEGGFTRDFTQADGPQAYVYDAAQNYQAAGTPLVVLAGKEYGSGSSRDWAAKGTALLGVKAVIAESYERIHRSNLIGMGVLPLQFPAGQNAASLGLTGTETFAVEGVTALNEGTTPKTLKVTATAEDGTTTSFDAVLRIDTPGEADYYRNGGILQYVLRQISAS